MTLFPTLKGLLQYLCTNYEILVENNTILCHLIRLNQAAQFNRRPLCLLKFLQINRKSI